MGAPTSEKTAIIISGTVNMPPENIDAAMAAAGPLIAGALTEKGCQDYDWCPDPQNPGTIRVFERWASEEDLHAHLNDKWYFDMRETLGQFGITGADTAKYKIELQEPVYDETGVARADFFTA